MIFWNDFSQIIFLNFNPGRAIVYVSPRRGTGPVLTLGPKKVPEQTQGEICPAVGGCTPPKKGQSRVSVCHTYKNYDQLLIWHQTNRFWRTMN